MPITVTRTSSDMLSSITAPKMMFAFGSAAFWMISAASLTSNRPRSLPAGDVQQDAGGAVDRLFQQRRGDRGLGGVAAAVLATGGADAHQGRAGVLHDRAHVGEVEVDQAGDRDQVGDALHALAQHVVGLAEGVEHRGAPLDHGEQLLVGDHDQRVDDLAQALDALGGLTRALGALEVERARDDADRERADLVLGDLGDHGGGAGAGAAALAGRHEHHVGALQRLLDLVARLRGGGEADVGVRPGAEALGRLVADVQLDVGVAHRERLGVGVGGDELDAAQTGVDHAADRVGAAAAHPHDLDDRQIASAALHDGSVRTLQ